MNNHDFNSVQKALFDYTITSERTNPEFITNDDKRIQTQIQESLHNCNDYDIAVSYVKLSGLQRLLDGLNNKSNSRFITTTDGYVTDPTALEKLYELSGVEVRVFVPEMPGSGFHAKTYLFKNGDNNELLVGSANISNRAFGSVHEAGLFINIKEQGDLFKKYQDNFDRLWATSKVLTPEFINNYREEYFANREMPYNPEFRIQSQKIRPNIMQEDALEKLSAIRQKGHKKSLVIAATGTGKTYLSAFDTKQFLENNPEGNVLFLVHNRTILRKSVKTFQTIFPEHNIPDTDLKTKHFKEGHELHQFVFVTVQTMKKVYDKFTKDHFDYIIVDEAHHTPANTYKEILKYFTPKFLLGMTATPDRTDAGVKEKDVYSAYEHIIPFEVRLQQAIESNLICPFNYYGIGEDLASEKFTFPEKAKVIKDHIEKFGYFGYKLKALVFTDTIDSSKRLSDEFNNIGITSAHVDGGTDSDEVDLYLKRLDDDQDDLKIITSVDKLNEGIDVPGVNTIIMLRKTASPIIFIQQLGRGLRILPKYPDKFVTVLDFVGNDTDTFKIIQGIMDKKHATNQELKKDMLKQITMLSNIQLDEKSRQRIYASIDARKAKPATILRDQFKNYVDKYGNIPSMVKYDLFTDKEKLPEIFIHFQSFQDMKIQAGKLSLSDRAKAFFRFLSEGPMQGGTQEQIRDLIKLLKGHAVKIDDSFFKSFLLNKVWTHAGDLGPFFKKDGTDIKIDVEDLLLENEFQNELNNLIEFLAKNDYNRHLVLYKDYQRSIIRYMSHGKNMKVSNEGEFFEGDTLWCIPGMARPSSSVERKFNNYIIDSKHIRYFTRGNKYTDMLANGDIQNVQFFIKHVEKDSDKFVTYIGKGNVVDPNDYIQHPTNEKSKAFIFELENELPEWMVKDYQINK